MATVKRRSMRHLPKFSKLTWAVLICFAALVVILWLSGDRCDVRVLHIGYTNAPPDTGAQYALYGVVMITNAGSGNITLWPEFMLEGEGSTTRRWSGTFHEVTGLVPAGSARQMVPVPLSVDRWRFTALCSPDCFRTDLGEYLGTAHKGWSRTLLRDWLHIVPVKRVSTEWMSNETLNLQARANSRQPLGLDTNRTPESAASHR